MTNFDSSEKPLLTGPRNTAEAMLVGRLVRTYIEDAALMAKADQAVEASINRQALPVFNTDEVKLVLCAAKHVTEFVPEDEYVVAAAQMFIDERTYPEAREMNDMRVADHEERLEYMGAPPYMFKLVGYQALAAGQSFIEAAGRELASQEQAANREYLTQELAIAPNHNAA